MVVFQNNMNMRKLTTILIELLHYKIYVIWALGNVAPRHAIMQGMQGDGATRSVLFKSSEPLTVLLKNLCTL